MSKHFVLVSGNIGAGKTSITRILGNRLGWQTGYESVTDNPYLSDFYADMATWSFHLQIFFLGHRAEQHLALAQNPRSAIADRSIYEDAHIFARALRELGNLSDRDYAAYQAVYARVLESLPKPDLLLHLTAPIEVLLSRIQARGRAMERTISAEYLTLLESYYNDWLDHFDDCPVLTIQSDDLNFVNEPEHLDIVLNKIEDKLSGHEKLIFTSNDETQRVAE